MIRWMIRRDHDEVLEIERQSFENPWTEDDLLAFLLQRNSIGSVFEHDRQVVGYMLYELHRYRIRIVDFAVATEFRRCGIGRHMVERLIDKLSQQKRNSITLEVREKNLPAQLFFSAMGFRAVDVLRDYGNADREDAYLMRLSIEDQPLGRVLSGELDSAEKVENGH